MSSKFIRQLRRAARAVGVPRLLGRFTKEYERAFSKQLTSACQRGDTVWDVGANVGHYSVIFSKLVGTSGRVFAFEPSAVNLGQLRSACAGEQNVQVRAFGLSDKDERQRFMVGSDSFHATSRVLLADEQAAEGTTEVELRTGDGIIATGDADFPNVVKIDVEGHELAVLSGMQNVLSNPQLRSVFVEVHFGVLDSSGRPDHPERIEGLLKRSGFKLSWTDPSHIFAARIS